MGDPEGNWPAGLLARSMEDARFRGDRLKLERIYPRLVIANQQQGWNVYPGFVEISPNGHVVYRQKVWGWFSQPLDLRDFPWIGKP